MREAMRGINNFNAWHKLLMRICLLIHKKAALSSAGELFHTQFLRLLDGKLEESYASLSGSLGLKF